jgi:DNA-binding response OmpR family regulator
MATTDEVRFSGIVWVVYTRVLYHPHAARTAADLETVAQLSIRPQSGPSPTPLVERIRSDASVYWFDRTPSCGRYRNDVHPIVLKERGYSVSSVLSAVDDAASSQSYNPATDQLATTDDIMNSDSDSGEGTILVVDDEREVTDAYALRLRRRYADVRTAYGGEEALAAMDEDGDVDVVLLDRRMPYSGDRVLRELRDRGYDCRVIMVTAVDPGYGIVDMPFDDYLCKPIDREDMFAAIDQQLAAASYDDPMTEFFALTAKLSVLEAEHTPEQLDESGEYVRMRRRAEALRDELSVSTDSFDEMVETFTAIDRGG